MSDKTIQRIQEATNDSFSYGEPGSLEKKLRIFSFRSNRFLKTKRSHCKKSSRSFSAVFV